MTAYLTHRLLSGNADCVNKIDTVSACLRCIENAIQDAAMSAGNPGIEACSCIIPGKDGMPEVSHLPFCNPRLTQYRLCDLRVPFGLLSFFSKAT